MVIVMADASDDPADIVAYHRVLEAGLRLRVRLEVRRGLAGQDYPRVKLVLNRIVNLGIRVLFRHGYNDTTNAFKAYRREVIETVQPLFSNHFNLTVELPLKAIARGSQLQGRADLVANRTSGDVEARAAGDGEPVPVHRPVRLPRAPSEPRRLPSPRASHGTPDRVDAPPRGRRPVSSGETAPPDVPDMDLEDVYGHRFSDAEARAKDLMWREICRYLQREIDPAGAVLDLACDRGDFIRNIARRREVGVRRPGRVAAPAVRRALRPVRRPPPLEHVPTGHFDVVFMSNYLEHLASSDVVVEQMRTVRRAARPGGAMIVLQPNIRLVGSRYWDFVDHKVALTEREPH